LLYNPQPFQYPLPEPPTQLPGFDVVKQKIVEALDKNVKAIGMFIRLAWQCSPTFRSTDYLGGCNGARIRFPPQKDWPVNVNLENALFSSSTNQIAV
jgi:catalase-peroxidase